jgi:hypothetical protein
MGAVFFYRYIGHPGIRMQPGNDKTGENCTGPLFNVMMKNAVSVWPE